MGDALNTGSPDEHPLHQVELSDFMISKFEITNRQYCDFLNRYGSPVVMQREYAGKIMIYEHRFGITYDGETFIPNQGREDHPVVCVTWYGAHEFAEYYGFRLPTEAEWEYAARGGAYQKVLYYSGANDPDQVAWCINNSGKETHKIGKKQPNTLGIYDMSGNVWEWCLDWYGEYPARAQIDPQGLDKGIFKVVRGGSWEDEEDKLRCTFRYKYLPNFQYYTIGFRVAKDIIFNENTKK